MFPERAALRSPAISCIAAFKRLGEVSLLKSVLRLLGFALAGLAQAAAIAAPWNGEPLWWLQLGSLAALVWQLDRLRAAGAGWRRDRKSVV